jgi:hypothetical protein
MSDYQTAKPVPSVAMYKVPAGYKLWPELNSGPMPADLGRIASALLARAIAEKWKMPSDLFFEYNGKRYIGQYQIHGKNRDHTGDHPGIAIYEWADDAKDTKPTQKENTSTGIKLGTNFYLKLDAMCKRLGTNPKDMLAIMNLESALNPGAIGHKLNGDPYPARGLTQIEDFNYKMVGWKGDARSFREEFGSLPAEEQLPYIERYFQSLKKSSGNPLRNLTQLYITNLWPKALSYPGVKREDPSATIIDSNASWDKERRAYHDNRWLDLDHDGKISYGDLTKMLTRNQNTLKSTGVYAKFDRAVGGGGEPEQGKSEGFLASLFDAFVNKLKSVFASGEIIGIECRGEADMATKVEFASILKQALKEEAKIVAAIADDGSLVVQSGDNEEAIAGVLLGVSDAFALATTKIGTIIIEPHIVVMSKVANEMELEDIEKGRRRFRMKFRGRS